MFKADISKQVWLSSYDDGQATLCWCHEHIWGLKQGSCMSL